MNKMETGSKGAVSEFSWMNLRDRVTLGDGVAKVNAEGMYYGDLNALTKALNRDSVKKIEIFNVYGQRYLGTGLEGNSHIEIHGTPGNDLGAFMKQTTLVVHGNAQDGCGNTMDSGKIIVHGYVGDIVGYSMRGGSIFVRDDAGYRAGIHMKEYQEKKPVLVIGGTAQDFLGEYMAGGILVVLGLTLQGDLRHTARFVGTGMHGGRMYIRGKVDGLSRDVEAVDLDGEDRRLLDSIVSEFCSHFGFDADEIMRAKFGKLVPTSSRPYERLYVR